MNNAHFNLAIYRIKLLKLARGEIGLTLYKISA